MVEKNVIVFDYLTPFLLANINVDIKYLLNLVNIKTNG